MKFFSKSGKIKNQAFLKRGTFSLAITAIVLAGLILLNVLVRVIDDRFPLEYDMTADKVNTISDKNIDFIEGIDTEVEVIVCADRDNYATGLIQTLSNAQIGITNSDALAEYCEQTKKLIDKYADYNDKITVTYVNPEATEFYAIATEYADYIGEGFIYGDIIVNAKVNDVERVKTVSFAQIYQFQTNEELSYYGSYYDVTGNNIESALTSAIANATIAEVKKMAIITGHSAVDYSEKYMSLLHKNGFEVEVIDSKLLTSISKDYDAVAIIAPTTDFVEAELDVISAFLNNDGVLGKSLLYFGDAASPYLPHLSDFLSQWGIKISEGVLFETDTDYFYPGNPTTLQFTAAETEKEHEVIKASTNCVTGSNIPLTKSGVTLDVLTVTPMFESSGATVAAPIGVSSDWDGASGYTKSTYYGAIEAKKSMYVNNELCEGYVYAFSSIDFINPQTAIASQYSTKGEAIVLAASQEAAGMEDKSISFVSKTITQDTFDETPTESSVDVINWIFVIILPICLIAFSIFVYIRRRNAE